MSGKRVLSGQGSQHSFKTPCRSSRRGIPQRFLRLPLRRLPFRTCITCRALDDQGVLEIGFTGHKGERCRVLISGSLDLLVLNGRSTQRRSNVPPQTATPPTVIPMRDDGVGRKADRFMGPLSWAKSVSLPMTREDSVA